MLNNSDLLFIHGSSVFLMNLNYSCVSHWFHIPQVRIALQMEDGSRLQGSFSCGQSLWDLLTHFPQIRCVYKVVCACTKCVCVHSCAPVFVRTKLTMNLRTFFESKGIFFLVLVGLLQG